MRSRWYVAADAVALTLYTVLQAVLTVRLWGRVSIPVTIVLAVLAAVVMDAISGVVHWAADTWGRQDFPVLGPWLLRPFREHHRDPQDIVRHGFLERSGNTCWLAVAALLPCLALPAAAGTFLTFVATFGVATNNAHAWAHAGPSWAHRLAWFFLLSPRHHDAHHVPPHTRNYCVLLGLWDPLLNRVFPGLERLIFRATGAIPRSDA